MVKVLTFELRMQVEHQCDDGDYGCRHVRIGIGGLVSGATYQIRRQCGSHANSSKPSHQQVSTTSFQMEFVGRQAEPLSHVRQLHQVCRHVDFIWRMVVHEVSSSL